LRWDKNVWIASEDAAAHLVRQYLGSIVRGLDEGKQGELLANRIEGAAMADRILKILRQRATRAAWDVNPEHLNTPAGLIDLRTGERRPARHDDYVRSCTAVAPDPGYPAVYMQAALDIFDGDLVHLQAWLDHMALSLVNRRLTSSMLILEGSGRNGKSLLLDVVGRMLGNRSDGGYAVPMGAPDMFDARRTSRNNYSDLAKLDGARAALFSEVDENFRMDEALLKLATVGERLTARRIYKPEFEFNFSGTITFAANVKIDLTSAPAMRQRVQTLRLTRRFAYDREFYDAVLADAPKVLSATITRCTEILRGAETFWLPASWGPSRQRFEAMRRASEDRFTFVDPVNAAVRSLVEHDVNGKIVCRVLFRTVREVLEAAARDDAADERLVEAAASSDRAVANQISNVMRDEFGETSAAVHGQRCYRRVTLKRNPASPFVGE
jgi:putative DNA primase/helicase